MGQLDDAPRREPGQRAGDDRVVPPARGNEPEFALIGFVLGVAASIGAAVHAAYELSVLANPPGTTSDFPNTIDPRGFMTFALTGVALGLFGWLIVRATGCRGAQDSSRLAAAVLLLVVYVGRLTVLNPKTNVIRVAALMSGLVLVPGFYVQVGRSLLREPVRRQPSVSAMGWRHDRHPRRASRHRRDTGAGSPDGPARHRVAAITLIVLGVYLVALPFALSLFSRARDAEALSDRYRDFATEAGLAEFSANTEQVVDGGEQLLDEGLPGLADDLGMSDAEFAAYVDANYPAVAVYRRRAPEVFGYLTPAVAQTASQAENVADADDFPVPGVPVTVGPWALIAGGLLLVGAGAGSSSAVVAWPPRSQSWRGSVWWLRRWCSGGRTRPMPRSRSPRLPASRSPRRSPRPPWRTPS